MPTLCKRRTVIVASAFWLAILACALTAAVWPRVHPLRAKYRLISKTMTRQQVESLLGPGNTSDPRPPGAYLDFPEGQWWDSWSPCPLPFVPECSLCPRSVYWVDGRAFIQLSFDSNGQMVHGAYFEAASKSTFWDKVRRSVGL